MSRNNTDQRVDEYINALPECQQAVCTRVRELAHQADSEIRELLRAQFCFILSLKEYLCRDGRQDTRQYFYLRPIAHDPEGLIDQVHDNATAPRAIRAF